MRVENWEKKLVNTIAEYKTKTFSWSECDCTTFAVDCIETITGRKIDVERLNKNKSKNNTFKNGKNGVYLKGEYKNAHQANKTLKDLGGETLQSVVDKVLDRKPLVFAARGDIVMYKEALGVCVGVVSVFLQKPVGTCVVKTLDCEVCWGVV